MESSDINLSFFDNVNNKVVDNLRLTVGKGSKVSIAAACFSIYAFNELKEQLQGTTTDTVWDNLVKTIGGIEVEEGYTLAEQIVVNDEREKLRKQILALEVKARQEKQPRRKLEMFEELQELKSQIKK